MTWLPIKRDGVQIGSHANFGTFNVRCYVNRDGARWMVVSPEFELVRYKVGQTIEDAQAHFERFAQVVGDRLEAIKY